MVTVDLGAPDSRLSEVQIFRVYGVGVVDQAIAPNDFPSGGINAGGPIEVTAITVGVAVNYVALGIFVNDTEA